MANTLEADIIKVLTETRDKIRANMETQHINASGRTSASMRVEPYDGGVRLIGGKNTVHKIDDYPNGTLETSDTAPIPTLEVGRTGGKVPKGFYYIIREWSKEKGLPFATDSERNTFSYFVARKIARTGTRRNVNNADVYSTPVVEAKEKINTMLRESISRTIRAAIGGSSVTAIKGAFT